MNLVYLFDLDNTLYPAQHPLFLSLMERVYQYMEEHFDMPRADVEALNARMYQQYGNGFDALIHDHGHNADKMFAYIYQSANYQALEACTHTRQHIQSLPGESYIFTNGPREHAEAALEPLGLIDVFTDIFCFRSAGFRSKPQLPVYEKILASLNVSGSQCTMIEDSLQNLKPAKELGMRTIFLGSAPDVDFVDEVHPDVLSWLQQETKKNEAAA